MDVNIEIEPTTADKKTVVGRRVISHGRKTRKKCATGELLFILQANAAVRHREDELVC